MARLLERYHDVELVEEAATVAEARALALENLGDIDVVVSELSLPDGEATDFLRSLREARADVPVLVLTFRGDRPSHERALELGAARVMSRCSRTAPHGSEPWRQASRTPRPPPFSAMNTAPAPQGAAGECACSPASSARKSRFISATLVSSSSSSDSRTSRSSTV